MKLGFSTKIQAPAIKPKERLTLKGIMHQKLDGHMKAGAFKKIKQGKMPKLKVPKLKG